MQTSQLMEPARRVMEDHLLMVAGFLGVMAQLMIVVGGLGLGSTMSLGVLERTREIGVLRAIGARHGAILAMVQVEGLVVGILSWAIALPLSIPMSLVLGKAFGRIMLAGAGDLVPQLPAVLQWLGIGRRGVHRRLRLARLPRHPHPHRHGARVRMTRRVDREFKKSFIR